MAVGAGGLLGAVLASPAPLAVTVQQMLHQVDSFVLLAFPLFVLAGALMETGGIARRLVDLAVALVGWVRGGLGMAVVAAEYVFSGISGSTVADVSAVASTTIPSMVRAGYSRELAVAIVSAASAMGILVPPCILMIVIGSIAGLSVAALFTAGFIPAVILAVAIMIYIYRLAGQGGIEAAPRPSLSRARGRVPPRPHPARHARDHLRRHPRRHHDPDRGVGDRRALRRGGGAASSTARSAGRSSPRSCSSPPR